MKPYLIYTSLLFLHIPAIFAQVSTQSPINSTSSLVSGGLQIEQRTDQERIDFLLQVASAYLVEEDNEAAISVYERIIEIDPLNKEARYILGHVYIQAKQYAQAENTLLMMIEENPDEFQLKNNLAWLYATAEDPAFRNGNMAIQLAQEAMAIAPYDHHVWSTLSEAYYVTGQYEKAYRAIEHMKMLAIRFGKNITPEMVEEYTVQIQKCQRAWDSEKALKGEDDSSSSSEKSDNQ
jgi:tetratricopeptide (TPR) repeat protein